MHIPLAHLLFFKMKRDIIFQSTVRPRKLADSITMPVYLASLYSLYTSLDAGQIIDLDFRNVNDRELGILEGQAVDSDTDI
jgi:hypothetical protein